MKQTVMVDLSYIQSVIDDSNGIVHQNSNEAQHHSQYLQQTVSSESHHFPIQYEVASTQHQSTISSSASNFIYPLTNTIPESILHNHTTKNGGRSSRNVKRRSQAQNSCIRFIGVFAVCSLFTITYFYYYQITNDQSIILSTKQDSHIKWQDQYKNRTTLDSTSFHGTFSFISPEDHHDTKSSFVSYMTSLLTVDGGNRKQHNNRGKNELFDVNGPPVKKPLNQYSSLSDTTSRITTTTANTRRGPGPDAPQQYHTIPTSTSSGRTISSPSTSSSMSDMFMVTVTSEQLHAAEALQCRDSVKNFVVNATDGKDECDGLIKAYDKTCSNNRHTSDSDDHDNPSRRHLIQRQRRKLSDKIHIPIVHRFKAFMFYNLQVLKRISRHYISPMQFMFGISNVNDDILSSIFFFAEDEVYKSYDDAFYMVNNNLHGMIQADARRSMNEGQCKMHNRKADKEAMIHESQSKHHKRQLQSGMNDIGYDRESSSDKATTTMKSLELPVRSNEHLSDQYTSEAVLIQQSDAILKAANESVVAKDEAAKSKQSISAVTAALNDPNSKEAIACCSSILNVYHESCSTDVEEQVSDTRLFFFVFVLACCGMIKSLIRHYRILWLPEAAGCIMVGVLSGYVLELFPHHDVSFDGNWFLRILVPPIIFQAALSIDKRSFKRHIVPILIYAGAGTLLATFVTAAIVHYGTGVLSPWCEPIPYVEALTFGALISSIDPIAVLSVLNNMGMNDTDTIYVLIFGESLLNDGVAIVLFHTLVHFLDESLIIDQDAIVAAAVHFFVVAFGSLLVGVASGMISTIYFWAFHGCQTPLVEVLMFVCWAFLPYYVCDGIGWSGIVAAVAVGFVMDLHIVGQQRIVEDEGTSFDISERTATSYDSDGDLRPKSSDRSRRQIFNRHGHLSIEAKAHVGFVTEIMATGMETAIFAYLGFFLFSHRYHWNLLHMVIAIVACCGSRAIMIPSLSLIANGITRAQQSRASCRHTLPSTPVRTNNPAGIVVDKRMQIALWFAGLRGAMSFALVESIPLYDSFSGEGTRLKPELKAMTSACILFTVFILGGYTYYILERLGIAPGNRRISPTNGYEVAPFLPKGHSFESDVDGTDHSENDIYDVKDATKQAIPGSAFRRQRHSHSESVVQ